MQRLYLGQIFIEHFEIVLCNICVFSNVEGDTLEIETRKARAINYSHYFNDNIPTIILIITIITTKLN